jgi:hypothetical protein
MTTTDITIYKSHTITKKTTIQALAAKLEAENQAYLQQQKKAVLFKNQLLWLNQKQLTSKLMWMPISKSSSIA